MRLLPIFCGRSRFSTLLIRSTFSLVSPLPETTPTLRWTGKVGDASAFRVWGSRAFVRDTSADKLSSRAVPCVFLGFPPDAPRWQFYHPTLPRVLSSQDITFDESVSYYRLFPYRTASVPTPPLFLAPSTPPVDPLPPPVSCPLRRAEPGGAEPARAVPGGALGVPSRPEPLSPQQLREWYSRHFRGAAGAGASGAAGGAARAGPAGAAGGATRGAAGVGGAGGAGAARGEAKATGGAVGAGGAASARAAGAAGGATGAGAAGGTAGAAGGVHGAGGAAGAGAAGAAGGAAGTGDPGAEGTGSVSAPSGGASRPQLYYLQPASPLPSPSPYSGPTRGLTERREPESRPVSPESRSLSPVCTVSAGRVSRPRPPPVPGTHSMTLRPSTAPQPVTRFLATAVTDPLFESTAASSLVTELVDFAAACRLDYSTSLVAESASASVCPPSVGGECALGTDVLENKQEDFECFTASVHHLISMLISPEGDPDAPDILTPRSYAEAIEGTYVDEVPPPGANIISGMWIFRVKRAPQAQRTITFTQSHMVQQVLQRFGFTYSSPQSTPLPIGHSLSAPPSDESVEPSGPYPELVGCLMYLMTCTRPDIAYPLGHLARYVAPGRHQHPPAAKRVLRYLCSTSGMGLVLGGRARVVLTGHADASWVDDLSTQQSSQGYTFSLGSGSISLRSTRSSSVLSSSCEAEIYAGAMAAHELRWLTYLLTDLGEVPRSPPVLYIDNKAMLALCQEHKLEHRTKHIALRYFLARELQQRGQLRLAYVASQANTADVFTKALQPCDHQRFCTVLGLVPTVPHLLSS
ncbi:unnamed protein product [Closterium sp. NIES-53]